MTTALKPLTTPTLSLPPRLSLILTQLVPTPDPGLALQKVISEYIDLKIAACQETIQRFEAKWGKDFDGFSQARSDDTLGIDPYSYAVESDFWEWEAATTLLEHYVTLRQQWM